MRAVKQGSVAGVNAAGGAASFANQLYPAALDAFGLKVLSHGAVTGEGVTAWSSKTGDKVRKLFFHDENTVGGILINDPKNTMKVMNAVRDSIERATGITLFEE